MLRRGGLVIPRYDAVLPVIPRYDAVLHVIPRYDAVSRKYPPLDPASLCGVTHATGPRIVVRGDPVRRGIQKYPPGHTALRRGIQEIPANGPRIVVRGDPVLDAESRNTLHVIPHLMRCSTSFRT